MTKVTNIDHCVYAHFRPDTNEIFYVGAGKKNRPYTKFGRNQHWVRIVNECNGVFIVKIIHSGLSKEDAAKMEVDLIKRHGRVSCGDGILCNLSSGGEGSIPVVHSPETIAKFKLKNGKNHNMYGIPKPETVKRKISLTKQGVLHSVERKAKQSKVLKEYYKTHAHHSIGYIASESTRDKLSKKIKAAYAEGRMPQVVPSGINSTLSKGIIYQYDKNTKELIDTFGSCMEAQKATGIHSGRITSVILGHRSQSKGFIFTRQKLA